jgi:hypothetical protein
LDAVLTKAIEDLLRAPTTGVDVNVISKITGRKVFPEGTAAYVIRYVLRD